MQEAEASKPTAKCWLQERAILHKSDCMVALTERAKQRFFWDYSRGVSFETQLRGQLFRDFMWPS
jgi:hypothetical protein